MIAALVLASLSMAAVAVAFAYPWITGICPFQDAHATWEQPSLWDEFPPEGRHGGFRVLWPEVEGRPFQDPVYQEVVLQEVRYRLHVDVEEPPEWLGRQADTTVHYSWAGVDEIVRVHHHPAVPQAAIEDGFIRFTENITAQDPDTLRDWSRSIEVKEIMENEWVKLTMQEVQIDGPYRFLELYEGLVATMRDGNHPDPYDRSDGSAAVLLLPWSFLFPTPVRIAEDATRGMPVLQVDARANVTVEFDRMFLTDTGFRNAVARIHNDLGLPPPPEGLNNQAVYC